MSAVALRSLNISADGSWSNDGTIWSLVWVQQGRAAVESQLGFPLIDQGTVLVLPKGCRIVIKVHAPGTLTGNSLSFDPDHLPCSLAAGSRIILQHTSSQQRQPTLLPRGNHLEPLLEALAKSLRASVLPPVLPGDFVHSCPCPLVNRLNPVIEELNRAVSMDRNSHGDTGGRVMAILSNLKEGELQDLTIDELARRCGCSRRHLARLIREQCGTSLSEIVGRVRIEKAAQLLGDPNRKIFDVALDCGFNHLGSFSARFRERFGVTPAVWRRQKNAPTPRPPEPSRTVAPLAPVPLKVAAKHGSKPAPKGYLKTAPKTVIKINVKAAGHGNGNGNGNGNGAVHRPR